MTHVLKKLTHPKLATSSHQYQQVPLDAESDSEDDEALLYAAPGLNRQHNGMNSKHDSSFGVGLYDHSCDLDLPRIIQFPEKGRKKPRARLAAERLVKSKVFACIFVLLASMLVALIAAFAVLVAGNWDYLGPSSNSSLSPSCPPVPEPLSNGKPQPCPETPQATSAPNPSQPDVQSTSLSEPPPPDQSTTISSGTVPPTQAEATSQSVSAVRPETEEEGSLKPASSSSKAVPPVEEETPSISSQISPEVDVVTDTEQSSMKSTTLASSSSNDVAEPVHSTDEPSTIGGEGAGSKFNVEILTEGKDTTSCFPVPSPLLNGQVNPSVLHSSLLQPSPLLDGSNSNQDIVTQHETIPMELADIATTQSATVDGLTPTATETLKTDNNDHSQSAKTATENKPQASSGNDGRLYWKRKLRPAASEATPKVCDLDNDGTEERLLVEDINLSSVHVLALNGLNGSTIWNQTINFPVFGLRCFMDINGDGKTDCFINGRGGGFGALSGADGHVLWFVDQSVVFPLYNFYFPQRIPDMDGDGIDDLVNTHGGDSAYRPDELNRSPGFLVVVSGRTGQKLLDLIPMPDGKETYMSPILFSVNGADRVILLGSGGETVPGSLWGVELASLRTVVALYLKQDQGDYMINLDDTFHPWMFQEGNYPPRPTADSDRFDLDHSSGRKGRSSCPTWGDRQVPIWNYYDVCLYEFVRTKDKGIILPPVIVDVTVDGVDDLVVSTFDGHTVALDGRDVKRRIWDTFFPDTESYSIPSPLYYTPDDIPDFLIRSSIGSWGTGYVQSSLYVLDGRDGAVLWTQNSSNMGMMSTISLMSRTHGRDAMIFYAVDVYKSEGNGGDGTIDDGGEVQPAPVSSTRRKRYDHEGAGDEAMQGEAEEHGDGDERDNGQPKDTMDYSFDLIHESLIHEDPPELWHSNGDDDDLPNPLTLDAYLRYCGETTISLYLVNREMVESGVELKPLAQYRPIIYFPLGASPIVPDPKRHSLRTKRHGAVPHNKPKLGSNGLPIEEPLSLEEMMHNLHGARCSHLAYPNSVVGTPLLTDLNSDGHQDIVYDIVWSPRTASPPQILAVAADLELLFEKAYGKGILDFSTFVPSKDQPWSQYMGKNANCVFRPPQTT